MTSSRFAAIAQELRERIALGEFGALGAIESEAELTARYAVSRPTVRRALEQLRDEGLVDSRHGAGWFVVGAAFHQPLALGTFRHARSAIVDAGKDLVREVVDFGFGRPPAAIAAALHVVGGAEVLHARSVRRVDGEGLDVVREWVPGAAAGRISRDDATSPGIWESLGRLGHRVATVAQTITAGLASTSDATLLGTPDGVPLLLVRRVAKDASGIPLALSDHRYLASRFALEVEFNSGPSVVSPEPPGLRAVSISLSNKESEQSA
ncbi:MAG TPA: GntR family transcriptional regulator [Dermatophilaceae bacterium]|nr:GntR family transcriptional regulator [Dermatophilaceae bacterium]